MAIPFYRSLRTRYPQAKILLVHPSGLTDLVFSELFDGSVAVSQQERTSFSGIRRLAHRLKAQRLDLAIVLPATLRAALPFWWAGVKVRVGFAGDGSDLFLTSHLRWKGVESGLHKSELYREFGDFLSLPRSALKTVPDRRREKTIVVAPGASIRLREWPYQAQLLGEMRRRFPAYQVIFIGTSEQNAYSQWLNTLKDPGITNKIGQTSLSQVVELCSAASAVIANDSGIAHLAATLCGTPTVVLFGPGNPVYVTPLGPRVEVVRDETLRCSPCEKPYCRAPYGYQACLQRVSPEAVLKALGRCLSAGNSL